MVPIVSVSCGFRQVIAIATLSMLAQQCNAQVEVFVLGSRFSRYHATRNLEQQAGTREATECHDGFGLAKALVDPRVQHIFITSDIVLDPEHWSSLEPVGQPSIFLNRSVLIEGVNKDYSERLILDLNYIKGKVQIGLGGVLKFLDLVIARWREVPHFQAIGLDLIASGAPVPPNGTRPAIIFENSTLLQRACLPYLAQLVAVSNNYLPRAVEFPGNQTAAANVSQQGCVNSSSARPTQRCWPMMGRYIDVATYGSNLDETSKNPMPSNYVIVIYNLGYTCPVIMSDACAQLGYVPCFTCMFPSKDTIPTGACYTDVLNGTAAGSVPASSPDSGNLTATVPSITFNNSSGGGGGGQPQSNAHHSTNVGAIVGGVLGGVAFLVVIAGVLLWQIAGCRQRRQDRRSDGERRTAGSAQTSSASGAKSLPAEHEAIKTLYDCDGAMHDCMDCATGDSFTISQVLVTPLTPLIPDIKFDVRVDGTEVQLSGVTLGKGAFGRVVRGTYGGAPVAVKLIDQGLGPAGPLSYTPPPSVPRLLRNKPVQAEQAVSSTLSGVKECTTEAAAAAVDGAADAEAAAAVKSEGETAVGGGSGCPALPSVTLPWNSVEAALQQEVEVLARCQHPNIVRLLAACLRRPQYCLVMELMETSLDRLMYGSDKTQLLPMDKVLHVAKHIANGLAYLHPTVVHRDLKPGNVLISHPDSKRPVVKLADFGLSRLRDTVLVTKHPEVGTAPYISPEAFDVDNYRITDRADVYALGVIIWEMLAGSKPWADRNIVMVGLAVSMHGQRPPIDAIPADRLPPKLRKLILACWEQIPARRPAAADIVKTLTIIQQMSVVRAATEVAIVMDSQPAGVQPQQLQPQPQEAGRAALAGQQRSPTLDIHPKR